MKIVSIFGTEEGRLLAIQYADGQPDALSMLEDQWGDSEYLRNFFLQHQRDYEKFYGTGKIKDRVTKARTEAEVLFDQIYELAASDNVSALGTLFTPLHEQEADQNFHLQQLKAYGHEYKSFLRIYAIRFNNTYVITGGAIKLTDTMQERPHTKAEYHKLKKVCAELGTNPDEVEFVCLT